MKNSNGYQPMFNHDKAKRILPKGVLVNKINKVYLVMSFDGDNFSVMDVFSTLTKANKYIEKSIKEDIIHYGFEIDSYTVDEYELK